MKWLIIPGKQVFLEHLPYKQGVAGSNPFTRNFTQDLDIRLVPY